MLTTNDILQYLKEYKSIKKESYSIKRLGIFGSYARGEANENSDIDIVVDFDKADLFNQISIMQELEEKFNTHIDVMHYGNEWIPNFYLESKEMLSMYDKSLVLDILEDFIAATETIIYRW